MRVIFMGTPDFAVPSLEALCQAGYDVVTVVTQPDRRQGRGQAIQTSAVKKAAVALDLPVFQPQTLKDPEAMAVLHNYQPDIIVVVAFGQLLPESILSLPPMGCINVHASLLPLYRGAAPIHWALLHGEQQTGITTMLMDQGLDTGAMLLKGTLAITDTMNFGQLHDALSKMGAEVLVKTLAQWSAGTLKPEPQDSRGFTYAPMIKRAHEIVDWRRSSHDLYNQIRGLDPWPGATTYYQGRILKIRSAETYEFKGPLAAPGTITALIKGQGFVVSTGGGSLLIKNVQPEGKSTMPAESFMNGYRLKTGEQLG